MQKEDFRIVFMGTPKIAVASLEAIINEGYNVVGVITAPDKPAGRGRKIQYSEVKRFALEKGLHLMQPENLKSPEFLDELRDLQPQVQVVVAFRMLPHAVWSLPPLGTFNLHASLLPQYRGAAPINRVLINGETKTGVTTFFLDEKIDTGKIIAMKESKILPDDTAGSLHDRLKVLGAKLVLETLEKIRTGQLSTTDQQELIPGHKSLKKAPKIYREDCRINWNKPAEEIVNLIRGLNPVPGAFTEIYSSNDEPVMMKIFEAEPIKEKHAFSPGKLFTDNKKYIKFSTPDGFIEVKNMQAAGKKRMETEEFLRGFDFSFANPLD
ncbi:MAG: methionyl-tRNA formyltransferase [Bacteroidetes bacterium]|nr:MAG: methionyl-tRNA formyltransferase [Bacteroidota bacterium]